MSVLSDALTLVGLLDMGWEADEPEDEWLYEDERWEEEVIQDAARALHEALQARDKARNRLVLIEKLENVDGRTPEEAPLFKAKARELRGKEEQ